MKILIIGDLHLRLKPPVSRVDDFKTSILNKLSDCIKIAHSYGILDVVFLGDIFDVPDPSFSTVDLFVNFLACFPGDADFYVILGNHDLFGYNYQSFSKTAIGLLHKLGLITVLMNESNSGICSDSVSLEGDKVIISVSENAFLNKDVSTLKIKLVHGALSDVPIMGEYIPLSSYETEANIVLSGHIHKGFDPVRIKDKIFFNPGALIRLDASSEEISRMPQIGILDTVLRSVDVFKLPSALSGDQVFDKKIKSLYDDHILKMKKFFEDNLNSDLNVLNGSILDLNQVIKSLKNRYSEGAMNEVLKRISSDFVEDVL